MEISVVKERKIERPTCAVHDLDWCPAVPDDYYGRDDGPRPFTQRNFTAAAEYFIFRWKLFVGQLNEPNFLLHLFENSWKWNQSADI